MVRTLLKVVLADVILLVAEIEVLLDLQGRAAYAASIHAACTAPCSFTPSTAYSILLQFFTMTPVSGMSLTSPPTLDWVQLLTYSLIILNGWYLYGVFRVRRGLPSQIS